MISRIFRKILARGVLVSKFLGNVAYIRYFQRVRNSDCSLLEAAPSRVLIVGTGPSVDRLSFGSAQTYDLIILLNHALKLPLIRGSFALQSRLAWFSCDLTRFEQLKPELIALPSLLKIFAAGYEHRDLRDLFSGVDNLHVVAKTILWQSLLGICVRGHVGDDLAVLSAVPSLVSEYIKSPRAVLPVHLSPTSALPAVMVAARSGAQTIDLIGCDFCGGRSRSLGAELGSSRWPDDLIARFTMLSEVLSLYDIKVTNRSWLE